VATLGMRDEALGKVWHTPNAEAIPMRRMLDLVFAGTEHKPNYRTAPDWLLTVMGWLNPVMRELKEMVYQFEIPFLIDHSEYDRVFADVTPPPPAEGIAQTVGWY
jgi:hypothetical protein